VFAPPPAPPPHDLTVPSPQRPGEIVRLMPGAVLCASGPVPPTHLEVPFATSTKRFGPDAPKATPSYALSFTIDQDGRAVDIQSGPPIYPGFFIDTNDLAPSLAASRFAPGMPQRKCTISYTTRLVPVPDASPALLAEVASAPVPGPAASEIWERLGADGDCARGPGAPRRLNYPPFEAIAQPSGTRSWSLLSFDVDATGRTRNVHVVSGSGNAALDSASVTALRGNRYAPGKASRGCPLHFYRLGNEPVAAPALPADAPQDTGDVPACTIDPKMIAPLLNGNAYPKPFAARRIEGYAIVGFDTAPWGAVGNVRVLASQPAASFGQAAMAAIASARVAESEVGHRGCVRRVQFRLPRRSLRADPGPDRPTDLSYRRRVWHSAGPLFDNASPTLTTPAPLARVLAPEPRPKVTLPHGAPGGQPLPSFPSA